MESTEFKFLPAGSKALNNSGGPRSRVRSEPVKESFFAKGRVHSQTYSYGLHLPPDVDEPESWVLEMAKSLGWENWEEVRRQIILPPEKLLALPDPDIILPKTPSVRETVEAAVILSLTGLYHYIPDGICVFTRARLERKIRLININTHQFYELE